MSAERSRVAFIGDVHLDLGDAAVEPFTRMLHHLSETCDSLVLMGDLFNLWIGQPELQSAHQHEVAEAFHRLASEHRIVLVPEEDRVWMAHPFSGVETGYEVVVGDRSWYANCAWDALGVLALMGDGKAIATQDKTELVWSVADGKVSPDGVIHIPVPAREFWDDIGFT